MQAKSEKMKLSKAVMGMKFMKKKEEVEQKERQEKKLLKELESGNWLVDSVKSSSASVKSKPNIVHKNKLHCVRETQDLYSTLPGRRSFNGCNKAMERHYQQIIDTKYFDVYMKMRAENKISDEGNGSEVEDPSLTEVKRRLQVEEDNIDYDKLVSLPRGPNQGKRPTYERKEETENVQRKKQKLLPNDSSFIVDRAAVTVNHTEQEETPSVQKMKYELIRKKEIRQKIEQKKKRSL